jgi:hypothetical protein
LRAYHWGGVIQINKFIALRPLSIPGRPLIIVYTHSLFPEILDDKKVGPSELFYCPISIMLGNVPHSSRPPCYGIIKAFKDVITEGAARFRRGQVAQKMRDGMAYPYMDL